MKDYTDGTSPDAHLHPFPYQLRGWPPYIYKNSHTIPTAIENMELDSPDGPAMHRAQASSPTPFSARAVAVLPYPISRVSTVSADDGGTDGVLGSLLEPRQHQGQLFITFPYAYQQAFFWTKHHRRDVMGSPSARRSTRPSPSDRCKVFHRENLTSRRGLVGTTTAVSLRLGGAPGPTDPVPVNQHPRL